MIAAVINPANQLCETVLMFAARGLCPATGGNFSTRTDADRILITESGVDKSRLTPDDLLSIAMDGTTTGDGRPSGETGLHLALYKTDPSIGAVLHGHSLANTVLSRIGHPQRLIFSGYEMQQAVRGQSSHLDRLALPVLDNSQDMDELAGWLHERFEEAATAFAFLVRGHGIYAWGKDLLEARRHLEGWEFLLDCELQRRTLEKGL